MKYQNLTYLNHDPKIAGVSVKGILYLAKLLIVVVILAGIIGSIAFGQLGGYIGLGAGILLSFQIALGMLLKKSKVPYQINAFVLQKIKGKDLITYEKDVWNEQFFSSKK